ncbi:MAG TPA: M23 family metallopeptidase [Mycobacteriales bacterium]|nr:M23 family metallopeptidase [Mycobacteriales bacterium]
MRLRRPALAGNFACLAALAFLGALAPGPAAAETEAERRARAEVAASHDELEHSSAAVQAAAAALSKVAAALPAAEREVSQARGELAGAQARATAATTAVRRAEVARAAAQRRVGEASAKVRAGRSLVSQVARRSYQQGPLGDLRQVLDSGSPQEMVDRAETLRQVFRGQNDVLLQLSRDRLALANTEARLHAEEKALETARVAAARVEQRAREVASRAAAAEQAVQALVDERGRALKAAEADRAADLADYQAAQAASNALTARLKAIAKARAAAAAAARARGDSGESLARRDTGRMLWPADGPMTSRYGYRRHPIYGDTRFHAGIDIGAGQGSPIRAADDGVVVYAGYGGGYGNLTSISHGTAGGRDVTTNYAHQSVMLVSEGTRVSRGQIIGRVGSTGNSTGPHLHFEVRLDGDPTDPLEWVSPP